MGSSFLSEVDDTSILRTEALHCYHYPLSSLPASRLLLPRSGLERSDFVLWHETDMPTAMRDVRSRGQSGKHLLAARISPFDPKQSWSAAAKRLDGIQKMSVHFAFEGHRLLLVNDLDLNRSFRLHMPTNCICPQQGVLHAARSKAREGRGQD